MMSLIILKLRNLKMGEFRVFAIIDEMTKINEINLGIPKFKDY